jgi:UDP-N-acetylglucosamine 4,6-dehydratase (inverting)
MLKNSSLLITGGTGSFGHSFVPLTLKKYNPKRLVIFSRDEMKQWEMAKLFKDDPRVRFFIGDVRDKDRLHRALNNVDFVVHAAATKIVPTAEYNPFECIKTNINGAMNLIDACIDQNVKRVVALSTDKAAAPINLYGATKLCSDKLFTAANNIRGARDINFSVVRYGNVMGSRGSVIPFFLKRRKTGILPITDPAMTRFNISLQEGVDMVLWALRNACGGEIFVPKIPSYRITDVAKAICPKCDYPVVGIRPGEKIHEEMITVSDSYNTVDLGPYYAILSQSGDFTKDQYLKKNNTFPLTPGFSYNSGSNPVFLTIEEIRELIRQHIDPA